VLTGPTLTNVNDVRVILVDPFRRFERRSISDRYLYVQPRSSPRKPH
jgi:hypothetical protein